MSQDQGSDVPIMPKHHDSPITLEDLRHYLVYCDNAKVPEGWPKPENFTPSLRSFYFWMRKQPIELRPTKAKKRVATCS